MQAQNKITVLRLEFDVNQEDANILSLCQKLRLLAIESTWNFAHKTLK